MASSLQEWKCSKLTRNCPYQKVKEGKWYFQFDYIPICRAKEGRSITKSNNSKRYNSIGYETFEECEKGK